MGKAYPAEATLVADNIANIENVIESHGEQLGVFRMVAVVGLVQNLLIFRAGANAT